MPPSVAGAKVTTRQLMVKMGQVEKRPKESDTPGRRNIFMFQNHVQHEWQIPLTLSARWDHSTLGQGRERVAPGFSLGKQQSQISSSIMRSSYHITGLMI
jgi:hypothetical protein